MLAKATVIATGGSAGRLELRDAASGDVIHELAGHTERIKLATGVMTFLILIFGEIFPKSIATRNNILIARLVIIPLYWLSILFSPIIFMLNFIPKLTGKVRKKPLVTEEELMTFVEVVEEEGGIEEEEKELVKSGELFYEMGKAEIAVVATHLAQHLRAWYLLAACPARQPARAAPGAPHA